MTSTPAGWYADPANPQVSQRFWDGTQWTEQVQPTAMFPPPNLAYPQAPAPTSALRRNQLTATTVGVCILYAAVAFYAHFAFIGILPVVLTLRAFRRREPLAAVAAVFTVVAVGISLVALAR